MAEYADPENTLVIETTKGNVVIEMRPDLAPNHVAHIKKLAREAQMEQRALWDKSVEDYSAKLKAAGVEFIQIDNKPFYDATAPVRAKYGAKFQDLMQRIAAVK